MPIIHHRRARRIDRIARFGALVLLLALAVPDVQSQSFVPTDWSLIAHYPLTASADDTTGINGPMFLERAPFANGGLFLNGIGTGDDPEKAANAHTPTLETMNLEAVAISIEFNTDSLHGNPVFVGGRSWRWAGVWIRSDSLMHIDLQTRAPISPLKWMTNTWHEVALVVNNDSASLFLDGVLGVKTAADLVTDDDKTISLYHGGSGITFYGTVRNLKVYSPSVQTANEKVGEIPSGRFLRDAYPNPLTGSSRLWINSGVDGVAEVSVFDILGREVWTFGPLDFRNGANQLPALPSHLNDGVYLIRAEAGGHSDTQSIVLAR